MNAKEIIAADNKTGSLHMTDRQAWGELMESLLEKKDYTYFGIAVTQPQFAAMLVQQNKGVCPFCKRTGLTNRYGSNKKHILSCAKKVGK